FCTTPFPFSIADFLQKPSHYLGIGRMLQKKRDLFLDLIKDSRFSFKPSSGTYFQLLDYSRITDEKDTDFAVRLTKEHKVASIPVSVFYPDEVDNKVLRFCFAKREETLQKAAEVLCKI
ncbi:MAG: aminotransferase class I/II-fold pyridoxal phosphate-dependent enzyme, partial [Candidatus Aminicenantes bacterium]|nr:aminotransferase class I/II-fold pyridoxal phosphate-dependent enzyme [Candidatus Aminicenantes bacterium]